MTAMFQNLKVAVVVPAYNEQKLISRVIDTMPSFVDAIVVVNDCSKDNTSEVVRRYSETPGSRVVLIDLKENQGVGGAIAAGYIWVRDHHFDCAAVMAGDAQMNPDDLATLLKPIADNRVDYSKGNRLITGEAFKRIPKVRYFGNANQNRLGLLACLRFSNWLHRYQFPSIARH
jgi:glycosyltransferase involved in cell wall biosynthesis